MFWLRLPSPVKRCSTVATVDILAAGRLCLGLTPVGWLKSLKRWGLGSPSVVNERWSASKFIKVLSEDFVSFDGVLLVQRHLYGSETAAGTRPLHYLWGRVAVGCKAGSFCDGFIPCSLIRLPTLIVMLIYRTSSVKVGGWGDPLQISYDGCNDNASNRPVICWIVEKNLFGSAEQIVEDLQNSRLRDILVVAKMDCPSSDVVKLRNRSSESV